ncbi:MAG: hypothetical protein KJS98_01910 [Nitrospirae bacterium]|nr:hypothetical protein [Nitrospirota bacterium]
MTAHIFSRPLISTVLAMTVGLGTGCSHWIELTIPTDAAPPTTATVATDARVPLLLETLHVTQNGAQIAPPSTLERQVLGAIEATRLFSQHYQSGYTQPAADQARVTMRLTIDNNVEPHGGQAAWRGFVVGASIFTLAPFISLNYDYGTQMVLEMERWDGQIKQYTAASNGSAHYNLFGASPDVIEQLKGQVTEACLSSLLNQVIQDSPFYLASSAQSQDHPIRTVSVGVRRPSNRAIPVSRPLSDASR